MKETHTLRKIILGLVATAAIATPLVGATAASADVQRCQETVPVSTTSTSKATFTVNQPKDTVGQFDNVWKHVYAITVEPTTGTFSGDGQVTANGVGAVVWTEAITGRFLDNDGDGTSDHVTFNTTPNAGVTFSVANAPMDGTTVPVASPWEPNAIEFQIAQPVFETVAVNGLTDSANHGAYVAAMGGGKAAAQSCVGMPIKSNKVK